MRQLLKDQHLDKKMTNLALNQTLFCGQPAMAENEKRFGLSN